MLLFFLNLSLNKFGSGKTKSVPHSPGLPYDVTLHIHQNGICNQKIIGDFYNNYIFKETF